MATIDWVVGGIIGLLGLVILYRALKEPIDLIFGLIRDGFSRGIEMLSGSSGQQGYEVIRYG